MNPVREALAKMLKGDAGLKKLATGGIFHRLAPSGSTPPYVIFHKATGNPAWAFSGPSLDRDYWVIKGVGEREAAEDIDQYLRKLLDGADLTIEGKAHQDLRHMADVDYDEIVSGERIDHVGAEYKLDSEYE